MERMKMPRQNRAPQFAPFDALKGLHEALRLAEYEHERIVKGEISEEQAEKISTVLQQVNKNTKVKLKYFYDGYERTFEGKIRVDVYEQIIEFGGKKYNLDCLLDIEILNIIQA